MTYLQSFNNVNLDLSEWSQVQLLLHTVWKSLNFNVKNKSTVQDHFCLPLYNRCLSDALRLKLYFLTFNFWILFKSLTPIPKSLKTHQVQHMHCLPNHCNSVCPLFQQPWFWNYFSEYFSHWEFKKVLAMIQTHTATRWITTLQTLNWKSDWELYSFCIHCCIFWWGEIFIYT